MKKTLTVVSTLLLAACGSSGSDSNGNEKDSHQLSMAMETSNLCGQTSQYNHYEVVAYDDNGDVISRSLPDANGHLSASFEQSHVNLAIIRDAGENHSDKKDLDVTYLAQYPVGDLGTLTVKTDDTDACHCQTATVVVTPGNLTSRKLNLPSSNYSFSNEEARFKDVKLCDVGEGQEVLLVANHLDPDSGFIYYRAIENASQYLASPTDEIQISMLDTGQVGRGVTVNTVENSEHYISYVTDQLYNYSVPAKMNDSLYMLDHDRVEKVEFHAFNQLDALGLPVPSRIWGVRMPITDETTDISYNKPEFEPELLNSFFSDPTTAYNLDGDQYRVIMGRQDFERPDGTTDGWHYILPSQSSVGVNIELPADYLEGLPAETEYQSLASYRFWDLNEISTLSSLDEVYQSDWLKIFLPVASIINVSPPAEFSYVSLQLSE